MARALLLALLLGACAAVHEVEHVDGGVDAREDAETPRPPVDAPPVTSEGSLRVATTPDGALHVVRVEADGRTSRWGPPLAEANPPVERAGHLYASDDARRVVIQDGATIRAHALRGDRWIDLCAEQGSEECFPTEPSADLSAFLLHHGDAFREGPLVSYSGEVLVAETGSRAVHSPAGWTATFGGEPRIRWPDGTETSFTIERHEFPLQALASHLVMRQVLGDWSDLLDPRTGEREALACADGTPAVLPSSEAVRTRWTCCGERVFMLGDAGLEDTGHRTSEGCTPGGTIHVEADAYTVSVRGGWSELTAGLRIESPEGEPLAEEERSYDALEFGSSYAQASVSGFRATPDRFTAYLVFRHMVVGPPHYGEFEVERDHGILRWTREGGARWHPIPEDEAGGDIAASGVWFPRSADRAFWVTTDGRLLSFEGATATLVDHSGDLRFESVF